MKEPFDISARRAAARLVADMAPAMKAMAEARLSITRAAAHMAREVNIARAAMAPGLLELCRVRDVVRQVAADMPEEVREEMRRLLDDAPPCAVDVNANDAGVM